MQSIQRPKTGTVTHRLNLVQNVDVSRSIVVSDILTLQQTVRYNVVRNFNIAHTLILYNGVSAWLTNPDFIYNRPVFTIQERVRFRYKSTDILLRKPDFDDTYRYEFTRIDRRSRGGDILISRDPIWPDNKTFKIAFSYLNEEEINKLHAFMEESLGKTIRYLNYDSVEWEGYITNPQTESAQVGRANYSIAIEFQGEPLP